MLGLALAASPQATETKSAQELESHCFYSYADSLAACNEAFVRLHDRREQAYVLLAKGMLLNKRHEFEQADAAFRQAVDLASRNAQVHLIYAWALDLAGSQQGADEQYKQAITLGLVEGSEIQWQDTVTRLIRNLGDNGDFYLKTAQGFERIGNKPVAKRLYLDAAAEFEKVADPDVVTSYEGAVRMDPADPDTHYHIALFWQKWDDEHAAEVTRQLEEAVKLGPNVAQYRYALAHQYLANGDAGKAVTELHEALRLKPDFAEAQHDLEIGIVANGEAGVAAAETPDTADALQQLRMCIDANGIRSQIACRRALKIGLSEHNAAEAHTFLAQTLTGQEAIKEFNAAIEADPSYALAYYELANVNSNATTAPFLPTVDPAPLLVMAAKLRPDWVAPRRKLAAIQWGQRHHAEAIATEREALAIDPEDATMAATLKQWQGDYAALQDGLRQWAAEAQAKPNDAYAQMRFGDALFEMGRNDEAHNVYRTAYKLDPSKGESLGENLLSKGFADIACEILPRSTKQVAEYRVAIFNSDLEICARTFPQDTEALTALAESQMKSGDNRGAMKTYEQAIKRDVDYFDKHPQDRALYDRARTLVKP